MNCSIQAWKIHNTAHILCLNVQCFMLFCCSYNQLEWSSFYEIGQFELRVWSKYKCHISQWLTNHLNIIYQGMMMNAVLLKKTWPLRSKSHTSAKQTLSLLRCGTKTVGDVIIRSALFCTSHYTQTTNIWNWATNYSWGLFWGLLFSWTP